MLHVNLSGFQPGEYQLLSIVHNVIYAGFDQKPPLEVRSHFLDQLIYKMETMSFTGNILRLLQSSFSNRYQRVTNNGQTSDWLPILTGVPEICFRSPSIFGLYQ